jgi:hypothetical protein
MNKWLAAVGKLGLQVAKDTIPGINAVEHTVQVLRSGASGPEKLEAVKAGVLGGISVAEFGADKDLLRNEKVSEAWDGFVASYIKFTEALATAKAAKAGGGA